MLIHTPKELAMFVANQRKKLKLSQTEVASKVRLKQKTISAFENKPEGTKLETIFLILYAVKIDLSVLEKGIEVKANKKWREEW